MFSRHASAVWPVRLPAAWPVAIVLLVSLTLVIATLASLPSIIDRLTFVYQLDPSEGVILGETRLLLNGVDIYQPARPDFFAAAPYPPLYYLLLAPLLAAGLPPFPAARAVVGVATVLLALAAGLLVARRTGYAAAGLLTAALWLAPNLVAVWSVRARPDLLAFAVNLLGLAAVWTAYPPPGHAAHAPSRLSRPALLAIAAILFTAGFYFKHTALAAPAAAGLYLLVRAPKAAVALGAATGGGILAVFAALDLMTDGGLYQHLVAFHRSWYWHNYQELAGPFFSRYWPLFLLPAAAAVLELVRARRPGLPTLYLLTALVVSLGAGTHGGNHNHLLETLLAVAIASGAAVGWAFTTRLAAPALLLVTISTIVLLTEPGEGRAWLAPDLRSPPEQIALGWQQILAVVEDDPGPVYSDNVGLLVLADQPIEYTDPFTLAYASSAGLWSDADLVRRVRARQFSLIALRYDVNRLRGLPTDITPGLAEAIRDSYVVAERNVMFLYRPR